MKQRLKKHHHVGFHDMQSFRLPSLVWPLVIILSSACHGQDKFCKSIGDYTYKFNIVVKKWDDGTASTYSIGKFCSIADNLTIFLGGNHRTDWITTFPFPAFREAFPEATAITHHACSKGDVTIGNDVWIGENVTIMSGVTIGDGAVIGANTVVAKDIPPYAIAVGNPAYIARYRFDECTRKKLLKIQWWNWPIERIRAYISLLCSDKVHNFIDAVAPELVAD